jgi:hypothetical protein
VFGKHEWFIFKVARMFNVPCQTFCLISIGDLEHQKPASTMLGQKTVTREVKSPSANHILIKEKTFFGLASLHCVLLFSVT